MKFDTKKLKESVSDSAYKDTIAKYFNYSFDFDFLDLIAESLDYVDDLTDTDEVIQCAENQMIYNRDCWTILQHYCNYDDADWNYASEEFINDVLSIAAECAENNVEDEDEDEIEDEIENEDEDVVEESLNESAKEIPSHLPLRRPKIPTGGPVRAVKYANQKKKK